MTEYDEFQINLTLKFKIPKAGITVNSVLYTVAKSLPQIGKAIAKAFLAGIEEKAVEEKFNVKVKKVATINVKGKVKRLGRFEGRRSHWKKAIVTLKEGFNIDFFEGK